MDARALARPPRRYVHLLLALVAVLANGCRNGDAGQATPSPTPANESILAFETIEQEEFTVPGQLVYEDRGAAIFIVSQPQEVAAIASWLTENARTQLASLDYDARFALVVFQGWKQSTGFGVQIDKVSRQDSKVIVSTTFQEPQPGMETGAAETSPYHTIKVEKVGNWNDTFMFEVTVDGAIVASASHRIP